MWYLHIYIYIYVCVYIYYTPRKPRASFLKLTGSKHLAICSGSGNIRFPAPPASSTAWNSHTLASILSVRKRFFLVKNKTQIPRDLARKSVVNKCF